MIFALKKCPTDETITKAESDIVYFAQSEDMTQFEYAEQLLRRIVCCDKIFEVCALSEIFIVYVHPSVHQNMREFWKERKYQTHTKAPFKAYLYPGCMSVISRPGGLVQRKVYHKINEKSCCCS